MQITGPGRPQTAPAISAGTTPWIRRTTDRTMESGCLRWSFWQMGELKGLRSAASELMHSYHNVAKLRRFRGVSRGWTALACSFRHHHTAAVGTRGAPAALITAPVNLDVQVANLLPQRIAVEAEQVGGTDLVAPGRRQRRRQQRHLDFLQDPVIEARRRHAVGEPGKMR